MVNKSTDEFFNEKRKWQIALRRYIINKSKSVAYAPYFGIDIIGFREWIEIQFDEEMNWDNFSSCWQFEHIVPVSFFNLSDEKDLKLCWNFINIRADKLSTGSKFFKHDLKSATEYFKAIYKQTSLAVCNQMIKKIASIQSKKADPSLLQLQFLTDKLADIAPMHAFSAYDFERLNAGDSVKTLLAEHELMRKFG